MKLKKVYILILIVFFFTVENAYLSNSYALAPKRVKLLSDANLSLINWQPKEALKYVNELKKLNPEDPFYFYFQAKISFYFGNYKEASKNFNEFEKRFGDLEQVYDANKLKDLISSTIEVTKDFEEVSSEHFKIRFEKGKDRVLIDMAINAMELSYKNIGEALGYFPEDKVLVEIYPSLETFTKASGIPKEAVETSGTCALCNYNKIFVTSPNATLRGYRWLDTICHEYVHYIVYKIAGPKASLWMQEGLAKYLETRWRDEKGRGLNPGEENLLYRRLKADTLITFEQMTPSFAFLKTAQDVRLAFSQVMTIIEYLDSLKGMPAIRDALIRLAKGDEINGVFRDIYGMDLHVLLSSWKKYLITKGLKVWPDLYYEDVIFRDSKDDEDSDSIDLKYFEDKSVRKFVRIGDMLKSRDRHKASLIEYLKAKEESTALNPVLENKLAMSYYAASLKVLAKKTLYDSKKIFPDFVTSYVNLGAIFFNDGEYDKAIENLNEARDINPFNPFVYSLLVEIYKKKKNKELKNKNLEFLKLLRGNNR